MRAPALAALALLVAAPPAAAARHVTCDSQSFVTGAVPFDPDTTIGLGPVTLGAGFHAGRTIEDQYVREMDDGLKSAVFVRPGHRLVLRLAPRSRRDARLEFGRRRGDALRFGPCDDAGSSVGGERVLFWPGALVPTPAVPVCLHFRVRIDDRAPRRLRIPVGRGACRR
jgi:hypothetical protein